MTPSQRRVGHWCSSSAPVLIAALLAFNRPLYRFSYRRRGLGFALAALLWHWLYLAYGIVAFAIDTLFYKLLWQAALARSLKGWGRGVLVVCCGMLRSGSTLQYHLACSLVEAAGCGKGLGWIEHGDCRQLDEPGSLNVLKVHNPQQLEGIEAALRSRQALYIYSYRDLRDVVVSIQNKWNPSFRQVLRACYIEYILQSYDDWMALPGGYMSQYEVFVHDPRAEARAIAAHLGLKLPDPEIDALADLHTLEKQTQRMLALREAGLATTADGVLHADHIFSGAIGQWREALKAYQSGFLEHRARGWLTAHGYELSQPLQWRVLGILYFWYCYNVPERGKKPPKLF